MNAPPEAWLLAPGVSASIHPVMVTYAPERRHSFSFEEYVEVAELSEQRVEFWDGAILDMTGGSPRHSAICSNIARLLGVQLRGKPCRPFDSNLRVRSLRANRSTYADVTVVCGPLEIDPTDKTRQTVLNPSVLIEVLSPSTETDDRGAKLSSYKLIESVRAIVLVPPTGTEVILHTRGSDEAWPVTTHASGSVRLTAIDCELPLDEIYEDLPEEM